MVKKRIFRGGPNAYKPIEEQKKILKKQQELVKTVNSNQQLLVGDQMQAFLKYYDNTHKAAHPPKNYTSFVGKEVQKTRAHLFGIKGMEGFVSLDNAKLSSLVPSVRLFQEQRKGGKSAGKSTEFVFDDYQSPVSITSDRTMRGSGAGIKEVSIGMEGDTIATADRMYRVKLKLFFSSLEEVFKDRKDPSGNSYQYADLFTLLARDPAKAKQTGDKTTTIVRLEYGYHEPKDKTLWDKADLAGLISAIRESRRVLSLNLYKHNISYNENGSINLELEYHGYTERQVSKIDVFTLGMTKAEREKMRKAYNSVKAKKKASTSPSPSGTSGTDKELERQMEKLSDMRKKAYQSLLKSIMDNKKVYNVPYAAQNEQLPLLKLSNSEGLPATTLEVLDASKIRDFKRGAAEGKPRDVVSFFYIGDLLDGIIGIAKEENSLKKGFEFSFGSFAYKDTKDSPAYDVPISAIPISNKQFGKWFEENVIKKSERETYDLSSFFMDIMNLAMSSFSPAAKPTISEQAPPSPVIRAQTFSTSGSIPKGEIKNVHLGSVVSSSTLKNGISQPGLVEHFFIYGVNIFAEGGFTGSISGDAASGVYWLVAGSERGIVKKVSYSKADTKYMTEMRMTSDGFTDKQRVLWSLYKANVDMVGNPIFKPGMVVYITSNAFSQSQADTFGLGGYFMVLKVRNSIQDGKFKTELETIWTKPSVGS